MRALVAARHPALVLLALLATASPSNAQPVNGRILAPGPPVMEPNAFLRDPFLVGDSSQILFTTSATNVSPEFSGAANVYAYHLGTRAISLISRNAGSHAPGDGNCFFPVGSSDGRFVAFESLATNLGPMNNSVNIFHIDRQSGTVRVASSSPGGTNGNDQSRFPSISADGRSVVFQSFASNLVALDGNNRADIFLKDIDTGAVELISRDASGAFGSDNAAALSTQAISADGRYVAFASLAANMVPGLAGGTQQIYVRDRSSASTSLISQSASGVPGGSVSDQAAISSNGRYVAFRSFAANLVVGASSRLFLRDRQANTITAVPLPLGSAVTPALGSDASACRAPRVSDGGDVLMVCDMVAPAAAQVYLWQRNPTPRLLLISRDAGNASVIGNALSGAISSMNAAGTDLVFESQASNLVSGDVAGNPDIFFRVDPALLDTLFRNGFE